jgi:acetyl-CoA synthetase
VERHRITQFFTAPTAIRALMRFGDAPVEKHDLRSLRIIGSAGEPLNPEAWKWFERVVGAGRTAVVDAYWQVSARAYARARTRFAPSPRFALSPPIAPARRLKRAAR